MKLPDDNDIYPGAQVASEFNDGSVMRFYGLVAGMDFLIVSEYGANCKDPEPMIYKKR